MLRTEHSLRAKPVLLLPDEVLENGSFFAIPLIKSWRSGNIRGAGGLGTDFPKDAGGKMAMNFLEA